MMLLPDDILRKIVSYLYKDNHYILINFVWTKYRLVCKDTLDELMHIDRFEDIVKDVYSGSDLVIDIEFVVTKEKNIYIEVSPNLYIRFKRSLNPIQFITDELCDFLKIERGSTVVKDDVIKYVINSCREKSLLLLNNKVWVVRLDNTEYGRKIQKLIIGKEYVTKQGLPVDHIPEALELHFID